MPADMSDPTVLTTILALVTLLLVLPFTPRLRRRTRRPGLIRSAHRRLRSIDDRYRPSEVEVAALSGTTLAVVRDVRSPAPAPRAARRREAVVATIVARRPGRPRPRLLFDDAARAVAPAL
ncbi:MAG: hypothetical protein ACR2O6_07875 [Ilumatobacteraceae bacterium]